MEGVGPLLPPAVELKGPPRTEKKEAAEAGVKVDTLPLLLPMLAMLDRLEERLVMLPMLGEMLVMLAMLAVDEDERGGAFWLLGRRAAAATKVSRRVCVSEATLVGRLGSLTLIAALLDWFIEDSTIELPWVDEEGPASKRTREGCSSWPVSSRDKLDTEDGRSESLAGRSCERPGYKAWSQFSAWLKKCSLGSESETKERFCNTSLLEEEAGGCDEEGVRREHSSAKGGREWAEVVEVVDDWDWRRDKDWEWSLEGGWDELVAEDEVKWLLPSAVTVTGSAEKRLEEE